MTWCRSLHMRNISGALGTQMEDGLLGELRGKIIETLNLVDVAPEDVGADEPLVGGHLGIDSIDVLELVMMIEKDYGIRIDNKEVGAPPQSLCQCEIPGPPHP